jgi:hypothetical protein
MNRGDPALMGMAQHRRLDTLGQPTAPVVQGGPWKYASRKISMFECLTIQVRRPCPTQSPSSFSERNFSRGSDT